MLNQTGTFTAIFNFIGSLVCHQTPERTLQIGGGFLCVCARCTGIYIGLLAGLFLLSMRRKCLCGPPNLVVTLAMILPLMIDGVTQTIGLRTSTNQLRLLTGLFFGTAITPFLIYLMPILPLSRRLPIIRVLVPEETRLDDRTSWLPFHAFVAGLGIDAALFLLVDSLVGSTNSLFYWLFNSIIAVSLVLSIIVIPGVVLLSFLTSIKG